MQFIYQDLSDVEKFGEIRTFGHQINDCKLIP